ncbi:copper chaperone PCu(A)C [Hydrogenophaga sp. PAMC20947]|uniref:copper chaperone PCu(A)C n=1 Tax=Hydrogenophaga sp. PAMC20947 TaxID=2565558 RepID=UPI00109DF8C3|nr:copper chaperone PCu(A)C [Hydrogenophaga sp. PAMC20947]QCB48270.1 copper chaperone PCu(A)C [Hydrogenophaga sp. PAMC20947]
MKKLLIASILTITAGAWAQTVTVKVEGAWVRGTVATQKATGAFMRLTPSAKVRLVSVSSAAAGVAEIHEMSMENDVMKMRQIDGLDLNAGKATELKPGGFHIMLMDLKAPLKGGDSVPMTLTFEDAAKKTFTQDLTVSVTALGKGKAPNAMKPDMKSETKSDMKSEMKPEMEHKQ